jgi:hypothetical protein
MSNWRESILTEFIPNLHKLTLVADPDGLLTEETLALELVQRGFDIIEFNDAIEFRYAYEKQYRSIWDSGDHIDLVVVLPLSDANLDALPYDILQAGRKLSFNLGEIFPNLNYPVLESMGRSHLDMLFEAKEKAFPHNLGGNRTKDFILEHIFEIRAERIKTDIELLKVLIRLHYRNWKLPIILSDRLISVLQNDRQFESWPLDDIVAEANYFFEFLQERWPIFLRRHREENQIDEYHPSPELRYVGPDLLPFDHDDIRVYIDNLFVDGLLQPVKSLSVGIDSASWLRCGIVEDIADDQNIRKERLIELINQNLPGEGSKHSEWTSFAFKWAKLNALIYSNSLDSDHPPIAKLGEQINHAFSTWLGSHYSSLINLPPADPVMLHHVARRLARERDAYPEKRMALIVVDGLALDQWITLRPIMKEQFPNLKMQESAVFAWIPSLTSVSRQAIFSGKAPRYFPNSIDSTNSEESLWRQFWENYKLKKYEIAYQRRLGSGDAIQSLNPGMDHSSIKALGLVVDKVDKIMHGMQLGSSGMHNQVSQWGEIGYPGNLIHHLVDLGYEVWMTSDHGNIECHGRGRPAEGVIAETRGERARVYQTHQLRSQVSSSYTFAHEWEPDGLPLDYYPLVISGREAFVPEGGSIVGHGGISIEEVIVPLIKFEKSESSK